MDTPNHPDYPDYTHGTTAPEPSPTYASGVRELIFALLSLLLCMLTFNSVLSGGFNLGYCVGFCAIVASSLLYLGKKLRWTLWGAFHLVSALAMAGIFAYTNDGAIKFFVFLAMSYAWYQALAQLSGMAVKNPGSIATIGDAANLLFVHSFREMGSNLRSLGYMRSGDTMTRRKTGAVLLGLALSVPVLLVVIPLLMSSDAAFEGMMNKAIFFDPIELVYTVIFGAMLFLPVFSRGLTLRRAEPKAPADAKTYPGRVSAMTLNTILVMVSIFYLLYLFSQLAYFFSAFSGILPEGFTSAEYARRGFFEMCTLCAINLGLLALCAALVRRRDGRIPMTTRALSLFICVFCLVLVAVSISKMGLYIGAFGLTKLRVVTTIFDVCLAVAIVCVGIWMLMPKFPYMKVIVATVLLAVTITGWIDVDTQIARYNVHAYQSGELDSIDLDTLSDLSGGSTPYLVELLDDADPEVADEALTILARRLYCSDNWERTDEGDIRFTATGDVRGWNSKAQTEQDALESIFDRLIDKLVEMGYLARATDG